jgi:cell division septation protein DedD
VRSKQSQQSVEMPSEGRVDWYLPTLIVGMALAAFALGAATTIWLGMPTPGDALAQSAASLFHRSEISGPAGPSPTSAGQALTAQAPATAKPAGAAVGSATPPTASPTPGQPGVSDAASSGASAAGLASPAAQQVGDFSLQFGAFLDATNAKSVISQLAARGYSPASIDVADGYGQLWHYVRLGAFPDERVAALAASELLERTGVGAAIVRVSTANAGR